MYRIHAAIKFYDELRGPQDFFSKTPDPQTYLHPYEYWIVHVNVISLLF